WQLGLGFVGLSFAELVSNHAGIVRKQSSLRNPELYSAVFLSPLSTESAFNLADRLSKNRQNRLSCSPLRFGRAK
ncbi:MAG: hypothetical protein WBE02_13680, partial [Bradyrhizobium sp.]